MKYNVTSTVIRAQEREYRVMAGDEPSFIAWKLGDRTFAYGFEWRELCAASGIRDPMQVAQPGESSERFLIGERLRIGQALRL